MGGRSIYFLSGSGTGLLMLLNHTYTMERNKQEIRNEISKLNRMASFKLEDIGKFRLDDHSQRLEAVGSGSYNPAIDSLQTHYTYLSDCMWHSCRSVAFNWSIQGALNKIKRHAASLSQGERQTESYANNYEPKLKVVKN